MIEVKMGKEYNRDKKEEDRTYEVSVTGLNLDQGIALLKLAQHLQQAQQEEEDRALIPTG